MPELAEVFIMSEFLNNELAFRSVTKVEKHPDSKNKCDLSVLEGKEWKVSSKSRGKEMIVLFSNGDEVHSLKIGFGRVGSILRFPYDKWDENHKKSSILRMYTEDFVYCLYDFTRFSIWRWADSWDPYRSPDVYFEHNDWREHIYKNRKHKDFNREIFQILTQQSHFSGIGNFLRTEILARVSFSPFTPFKEILHDDDLRNEFFSVVKETVRDLIEVGGFQFKFWKNPNMFKKKSFNRWIRCYNKMGTAFFVRDSKGSKFWFHRRWLKDFIQWHKANEPQIQDTRLIEKIYNHTIAKEKAKEKELLKRKKR